MQIKRKISEGAVQAVANTSVFFAIPCYDTIDSLFLRPVKADGTDTAVADALATIQQVTLQADGNDIVSLSYAQIRNLTALMGNNIAQSSTSGSIIDLNISRFFLDIQEVRDRVGWGTRNVSALNLRIQCGTLTNVAAFEIYTVRRAVSRDLSTYFRALNYQQTIAGAGTLSVTTLPKNTNDIYYLLMLGLGTGGVVSWNRLRANSSNFTDQIPPTVNDAYNSQYQYAQPTGTSTIALTDGSLRSGLPVNNVTDIQAEFNFATAPSESSLPLLAVTLHNPTTDILQAIAA